MDNVWFASALWIGLALIAASLQAWVAVSVALLEIIIGAVAGNLVTMPLTPWVNYLAGSGAILLTFLAGAEIDAKVIRRHFGSTMAIGAVGFFAPYLGVLAWAHFVSGWPWPQAQIAGIALSTTSVAVVYAVMVETGFNNTEIGKIILAACFINDIGTVASRKSSSYPDHRLHRADPVLFSEGGIVGSRRCHCRRRRADRHLSRGQDDHQVRWDPAVDSAIPLRAERGDVHDVDDVYRPDIRIDFGTVRPDQSHHR